MAEGGGSEDVQSYLEQHRISSLFEVCKRCRHKFINNFILQTLMSKIVKECPADPIEFLIGKLQVIQRQRKKVMKQVDVVLLQNYSTSTINCHESCW